MQVKQEKDQDGLTKSKRKIIRFDNRLLEQINMITGKGFFSAWVKAACQEKLKRIRVSPSDKVK